MAAGGGLTPCVRIRKADNVARCALTGWPIDRAWHCWRCLQIFKRCSWQTPCPKADNQGLLPPGIGAAPGLVTGARVSSDRRRGAILRSESTDLSLELCPKSGEFTYRRLCATIPGKSRHGGQVHRWTS